MAGDAEMNLAQLWLISPLIAVFVTAMVVLLVDVSQDKPCKRTSLALTIIGLVITAGLNAAVGAELGAGTLAFRGMIAVDGYAIFFNFVLIIATMGALLIGHDHLERLGVRIPEVRPLLLFSLFGMMLMAMAQELMLLFIAIEVMSIALYVLCAIDRGNERAVESAFKYFILGAFSSAILLYGIALIWGATGTTQLTGPGSITVWLLKNSILGTPLMAAGVGMMIVGLGFKVGAVPFHMWSPDVYQGAPTPVTAFMATAVKAASFAALGRILFSGLSGGQADWGTTIMVLSGLTILVGNIAALVQNDIKRMLAYSSIGHAGYLLMAVAAFPGRGGLAANPQLSGMLFYLLAYTLMTIGAFAVVSLLAKDGTEDTDIHRLAGLGQRHPWVAFGMTVCLLSMAGIPPTMGFVGKFYLFTAAISQGLLELALVGAIGGVVGVYYYLRPIVIMYMTPAEEDVAMAINLPAMGALCFATVAMLVLGVVPGPVVDWCRVSLLSMLGG
jgi:NADH-quinone oxidoreductase subunit N